MTDLFYKIIETIVETFNYIKSIDFKWEYESKMNVN